MVHFAGHGTADGLVFEDEQGNSFVPEMGALSALLQRHEVDTVVLHACHALEAIGGAAVARRFTIATEGELGDVGAIELTRGLYDALGAGMGVEEAYEEGVGCARLKGFGVKAVLSGERGGKVGERG